MGVVVRSIIVLVLCTLSCGAQASRGFGTTFGAGTTDIVQSGYSTVAATNFTYGSWIWVNGAGGGSLGKLFIRQANSSNEAIGFNGVLATMKLTTAWSGGGQFHWTTPSSNAWHNLCITYNNSSSANVPVVYIDGVSVSVTTDATPSGTYTPSATAMYIGNAASAARVWDGKLAEIAYWNGSLLTANECKAFALGMSPLKLHGGPSLYLPLYGYQSNEQDWGPSHVTQTITGTVGRNHAPVQTYPLEGIERQ